MGRTASDGSETGSTAGHAPGSGMVRCETFAEIELRTMDSAGAEKKTSATVTSTGEDGSAAQNQRKTPPHLRPRSCCWMGNRMKWMARRWRRPWWVHWQREDPVDPSNPAFHATTGRCGAQRLPMTTTHHRMRQLTAPCSGQTSHLSGQRWRTQAPGEPPHNPRQSSVNHRCAPAPVGMLSTESKNLSSRRPASGKRESKSAS